MHFHLLNIEKIKQETHDTVSLTFTIPSALQEAFRFKAGQYVSLKCDIQGNRQIRSYSICSTPDNKTFISVGVKKMENGWVSKYINESLKEGAQLEVSTPDGKFFYEHTGDNRDHVLVAGGSGITPCLSIIKTVLQTEPQSRITLIYSVKTKVDKIFGEELESLSAANPRFTIKYLFTFEGDKMIDKAYAKELIVAIPNYKTAQYYACGPGAIISSIEHGLEDLSISLTQFHREYFTAKAVEDMHAATVGGGGNEKELAKGEKTKVVLKFEGKSFEVECGPNQKIIDVAIDKGIDAPYSCLVAACCTCRAKLLSGKVEMLDKDSLTDSEVKAGYVLTCQAQPRTHGIVLDYDL